jgi:hypothetical protein
VERSVRRIAYRFMDLVGNISSCSYRCLRFVRQAVGSRVTRRNRAEDSLIRLTRDV